MGMLYFLQIFWEDDLSKKIILEYDPSFIIRKYEISFTENMILFFRKLK